MSAEGGGAELADDLREGLHEATARTLMTPALRRRKLALWTFRQTVLGLFAWCFRDRISMHGCAALHAGSINWSARSATWMCAMLLAMVP